MPLLSNVIAWHFFLHICWMWASVSDMNYLLVFPSAPSASPRGLKLLSRTSYTATLSWQLPPLLDRNGFIERYKFTLQTAASGPSPVPISTASNATTFTMTSLSPFTEHNVTISAETSVGVGPPSPVVAFRTKEAGKTVFSWYYSWCRKRHVSRWKKVCTKMALVAVLPAARVTRIDINFPNMQNALHT